MQIVRLERLGFNYELVFDVGADETAASLLGERLLNQQSFTKEGWKLIGGGGTLMYSDGNRRWTFHTQPRPNGDPEAKRIFLGLNLHVERRRVRLVQMKSGAPLKRSGQRRTVL